MTSVQRTAEAAESALDAALVYAERGWRVLPLHSTGKRAGTPRILDWPNQASADADVIRSWWAKWPASWIGIACGPESRLVVVDLDVRQDKDGVAEWKSLSPEDQRTELVARTPRGGLHLYYETDHPYRNSVGKLAPGVDVRGKGGYVVAPPSKGREFANGLVDPGEVPDWLDDLLRARAKATGETASSGSHLADLLANPPAADAVGWNDWLIRVAGHYAKLIPYEDAYRELVRQAADSLDGSWEDGEVEKVATSAWEMKSRKAEPRDDRVRFESMAGMTPRRQRFLWAGRIPIGAITLVGGKPGVGKSTALLDLASAVTRGMLPGEYHDCAELRCVVDGNGRGTHRAGTPRSVAICATEEDYEVTILPRLLADHADLSRVFRILKRTSLDIGVDLDDMERLIRAHDVALVILDPLLSRLGKTDTYKDAEVRSKLEPLSEMAEQTRAAVTGIIHVTKAVGTDPLNALMGSVAFGAVARSALFMDYDPTDEAPRDKKRRLLGHIKCNVGAEQPTKLYKIEQVAIDATDPEDGRPIVTSHVVWQGETTVTISDALNATSHPARVASATDAAGEWLMGVIRDAGGQVPRREVLRLNEALDEPHAEGTLKKALPRIGGRAIKSAAIGQSSVWTWPALPTPLTEAELERNRAVAEVAS